MTLAGTAWLLFDGDCRICTAFARVIDVVDFRHRITIRPLQDARELLPGLSGEEILEAFRFVGSDGHTAEAHDAVIALASALVNRPVLEDLLHRSHLVVTLARRTYALLVTFRGHLTCRMPPAKARSLAPSGNEADEPGERGCGPTPPDVPTGANRRTTSLRPASR